MFDNKSRHHGFGLPPFHRRLLCETLEARTLLSISLAGTGGAAQQQTLGDLPIAAQHAISSAIGQDQSAYHAASATAGVTLANPANGFTAQLQSGALQVSAGSDTWDMSLVGLSYGAAMQPVGIAKTSTNGNRVDCNFGTVDEWYVNGPSGLEQGFTVTPRPQSEASGSLTVELALGGNLTGAVNAAGDGITLTGPNGSTVLGYTGLTACDARGKTLPASLEVRTDGGRQELLIHVNNAGAQGAITIDPFVQEAELTASDGAANDEFGTSVSIGGNTMVVGAASIVNGYAAAYVFTESGSVWNQTAKLTASDGAAGAAFGNSVAIDSNTVVVGAYEATVGGNSRQGAAYVFTESGSAWNQTAKLTASDGATYDLFGDSVAISGNTVVVGAFLATVGGNDQQGAAYVFQSTSGVWTQTQKLTASDGAVNDTFGRSVSIGGGTVVVGAYQATVGGNAEQGAAYVFGSAPLGLSLTGLRPDTVNLAYNQTIAALGGTGTVTLSVSNLQNAITGLTLVNKGNGSVSISGTPTATGNETFTITATDPASDTATANYSIWVNPALTLSPTTLPADTVNVAYSQSIETSGGTGTVTLAVSNIQNAISGLTVSGGTISGTPTATGTETFTVTVTDAVGAKTTANFSIRVNPVVTLSGALPAGTVKTAYRQRITASGGTGGVALVVSNLSGAIPGLMVQSSGTGSLMICGTPTAAGTETFTVTATDTVGYNVSVNYSITIKSTTKGAVVAALAPATPFSDEAVDLALVNFKGICPDDALLSVLAAGRMR
jgi:hypothetical protein